MPSIDGSCLCGAVTLTVARAPRTLTQCNCSTCRRYGTLWAYYRRGAVTIAAARGTLRDYSKRRGGLRFRHCATCGCIVSWEAERDPSARMAVNARLFDHAAMARVPIAVLDGDKTWRVIDRYVKPGGWISPKR
ncbi:MAG TPA: GFA family protein [Kofleriaceae bacterium]